ncbi:putative two-component response regulator ARR2-like [Capsicum annuum]|uniref:PORR domain-containing protein n=1 Tax=Capsicum annuum TaxID=4072 RepID=A0A2G3AF94_CAPAN|nr:protein WHAT'S THIS FACTOR 9, mitochondrial [Capsicum annuum]XP_016570976.2 protein WHAT'S THIS FACTOR 9, mitochondrial [Capsicum annuum]XP_016570981.2 protein WHAT'S THIS FACTOR 9, mitochondrial [Capsicum annuum]XP_016570986.2 protein WHAT'S THIS FACTOR 9, mitochondrial [Capsicum annuum]XP_016570991.2 protein WHAT'S THIS FACTOR 9, mitochondrial [Capsicum annuum]XP_047250160.1 protein WHAT'S THIS FACTOR 9, mitochondrial [Capsicum annuum]XP_047250162.1 protein WHAT'S THIS FACTOR 9, mitochon
MLRRVKQGCRVSISNYHQKRTLVNVKLKWVKDSVLDSVVAGGRQLKAGTALVSIIASQSTSGLPIYHLQSKHGQLGLPHDLKVSTFLRRYPNIFQEFFCLDSAGTPVPWFKLTPEALEFHHEQVNVLRQCSTDIVNRLRKLLMMTNERMLPLQTIDQLKWDLGLPHDFASSLIIKYPNLFNLVDLTDGRLGLKLLAWDRKLAVSHLEANSTKENGALMFPIGFTRGFGLKRKCMKWLEEWQKMPYTSPYVDASNLDPRTDVSEKRIVGVFHELLHLTLQKKTERSNVSNLRKPLELPQKFTKVFERHPGIFYISMKGDTQTIVLREAYDRNQLIEKHPLVHIREKFANMMKQGFLDRSRGLYRDTNQGPEEGSLTSSFLDETCGTRFLSDIGSESDMRLEAK